MSYLELYNTILKQRYLNDEKNKNNLLNTIDVSLRKYLELFLLNYNKVNINLLSLPQSQPNEENMEEEKIDLFGWQ